MNTTWIPTKKIIIRANTRLYKIAYRLSILSDKSHADEITTLERERDSLLFKVRQLRVYLGNRTELMLP